MQICQTLIQCKFNKIANTKENAMSKELVKKTDSNVHELSIIEQVVVQGDLAKLSSEQRVLYYRQVCESAGLNPFTKPFEYISLQGKLTLYAKKDATEQLRKINGISIEELEGKVIDDLYIVTAKARTKDGRIDQATGAVTIGHLKGDAKANAIMKAETKAKRRVTLSISGMGWTDESEIDSIPNAKPAEVDLITGEIKNVDFTPAKESKKPEKISQEQVSEITLLIEQCPKEFIDDLHNKMRQSNMLSYSDFSLEYYKWLKNKIFKELEKREEAIPELETTIDE